MINQKCFFFVWVVLVLPLYSCDMNKDEKKFSGERNEQVEGKEEIPPFRPDQVIKNDSPDFVVVNFDIEVEKKRLFDVIEASGLSDEEKSQLRNYVDEFDYTSVDTAKDFIDNFIVDLLSFLPDGSKETIEVVKDSTYTATENIVSEEKDKNGIRQQIFTRVFEETVKRKNISIEIVREITTVMVQESGYWNPEEHNSIVQEIVDAVIKATSGQTATVDPRLPSNTVVSDRGISLTITETPLNTSGCNFQWKGSVSFPDGFTYKDQSARAIISPLDQGVSVDDFTASANANGILLTIDPNKAAGGLGFGIEWSVLGIPDDIAASITIKPQVIKEVTPFAKTGIAFSHFHTQATSHCKTGYPMSIATGVEHTCGIDKDGAVRCLGVQNGANFENASGGSNLTSPTKVLGLPADGKVVGLAGTKINTCAILENGSMYCWGLNGNGESGNGTVDTTANPTLVSGLDGTKPSASVKSAAGGFESYAAVMQDGSLKTWGSNEFGTLGLGSTTDRYSVPQNVPEIDGTTPAKTMIQVDAGEGWMAGVMADGTIMAWGENTNGQLGIGNLTNQSSPVRIPFFDASTDEKTVSQVAVGDDHGCALTKLGTIYCWGGVGGEYTPGNTENGTQTPIVIDSASFDGKTPATTAIAIATYNDSNCAVMQDGKLKCWGRNEFGLLGLGDKQYRAEAQYVAPDLFNGTSPATTIVALNMSVFHACAATANGNLYCWGSNKYAAIGLSESIQEVAVPTLVGSNGSWASQKAFQVVPK